MTTARALLVLGGVALFSLHARADDTRYQDYPVGGRAATLGGAYAAISDDASGLTYNPAGIVDSKNINVSVSASLYGLERQAQSGGSLVSGGDFSAATLATLNVIPGEAGSVKTFGETTSQGAKYAYAFDITVPSFRSYGTDTSTPVVLHTRIVDRTFDGAAGFAMRINPRWSVGGALHFNLRLFSDTEDALVSDGASDPTVGVYHAEATFSNASLSATFGGKLRMDDGWTYGFSLSTPGVRVYSSGSIQLQDVVTNPNTPAPHTTVNVVNTTNVQSETSIPLLLRAGAIKVATSKWTVSTQLSFYFPTHYDRFQLDPSVADRLQLQTHVDRHAVLNVNAGGEYLIKDNLTLGLGFYTDFSSAPGLSANPDGSLIAGTSHLDNVSLYGGTASVSFLGEHSVSRLGMTLSYGKGEVAVPDDPTGISDPNGFTRAAVSQLFLYFFLAGSFKY